MQIKSSAFLHEKPIPKKYTCQGEDLNPPLEIQDIPKEAKSLVLIVDDPDAPRRTFVHWVVYNIPPQKSIKEKSIPGTLGMNDFQRQSYGGPCPPLGLHRYFFKLYAVDALLPLKEGATKEQVEKAMQGHILAQASLVGLYQKE